jgi:hypothetical protein
MFFKGRKVVEVSRWHSNCSECGHNYLGGKTCDGCGVVFKGAVLTYIGVPYSGTHFHGLPILEGYK